MKKGKNLPFPHQNRTVFSTTASRESESEDAASAAFSSDSPIPVSENRSPSAENLCQAPSVPRLQGGEKFHAMERACSLLRLPLFRPTLPGKIQSSESSAHGRPCGRNFFRFRKRHGEFRNSRCPEKILFRRRRSS